MAGALATAVARVRAGDSSPLSVLVEDAIRQEAIGKIKNVAEGTVDYEIALQNAVKDVKKRRGLM